VIFGMTPAQQTEHDRLKAVWAATTDPAKKAAAWAALATYDASLPAPPPPPLPTRGGSAATDFLAEHKTTLLVSGGLLAVAGLGYWLWAKQAKRKRR